MKPAFSAREAAAFFLALVFAPALPASAVVCGATYNVPGSYGSISAAISVMPGNLGNNQCIIVSGATGLTEQVNLSGHIMNGYEILISSFGGPTNPTITPPANSTAAFVIADASVTIVGFDITPANLISYGMLVTAPDVRISSVNIRDEFGRIKFAGVQLSSQDFVSDSSMTLVAAHGFYLPGSTWTTVSASSAQVASAAYSAIYLQNASSNTFNLVLATNTSGGGATLYATGSSSNTIMQSSLGGGQYGVRFMIGSNGNSIVQSTITSDSVAYFVEDSTENSVTGSFLWGADYGAWLNIGASSNTIAQSSMTGISSYGLYTAGASTNTVTQSYMWGGVTGASLNAASDFNAISLSTMVGSSRGLLVSGSSVNTVTQSFMSGSSYGAWLSAADSNTVVMSTMVTSGLYGLYLNGASSNSVTQSYMAGSSTGAVLDAASNGNTISLSTAMGGLTGLIVNASSGNTVTVTLSSGSEYGLFLNSNSRYNTISLSTMAGVNQFGFYASGASSNTVKQSIVIGRSGLDNGSNGNLITLSTMTNATNYGLYAASSSSNTIDRCYLRGGVNDGAYFSSNANYNTVVFSTFVGASSGLYAYGASSNTWTQSTFMGGAYGIYLNNNSNYNAISLSTMVSNGQNGLYATGVSSNVVTESYMRGGQNGANVYGGSSYNTIDLSTMVGSASHGFYAYISTGNSVTRSFMTGGSCGAYLDLFSHENSISVSTMIGGGFQGLYIFNAASNTVSQSYMWGNLNGADLFSGAQYNAITMSSMTGSTENGFYTNASNWNTVSLSSMRGLLSGVDLHAASHDNALSQSTATGASYGLYIASSDSNTVSQVRIDGGSIGLYLDYAASNTVDMSTMSGSSSALFAGNADSNTVSDSYLNGGTYGADLEFGSYLNTISSCQLSGTSAAFYAVGVGSNTVTRSLLTGGSAGVSLDANASAQTISESTMTGTTNGLSMTGASSNTVVDSWIDASAGNALSLSGGSNGNSISRSTATGHMSGFAGLYISGSSSNTVDDCAVDSQMGNAAYLLNSADGNALSRSTFTANLASYYALYLSASSSNTVSGSFISNMPGFGAGVFDGGGTIIMGSTITSSTYEGLRLVNASSTTIDSCYVVGSTGASISGSTGTVISGSRLSVSFSQGDALALTGGSSGLSLSSSVLRGGSPGHGLFLDAGTGGDILLSTNTFLGGRAAVSILSRAAGGSVWVASNTIVPIIDSAADVYGIYLEGLASGATVQDNIIAWRASGAQAPMSGYGLYATASSGLVIERNRVNNPGMLLSGSFYGVWLSASPNADYEFNDINSSGTGLTNAYMLQFTNASTGATVKNSVVLSSVTGTGTFATIGVDPGSQIGFTADYNDYFSSNSAAGPGGTGLWGAASCGLPDWAGPGCPSLDAHSVSAQPFWADASAGVEDFHLRSRLANGRFNPSTQAFDQTDAVNSGAIDAGDPGESFVAEPGVNGGRVNAGSYGGTAEASQTWSPVLPAGCSYGTTVAQNGTEAFTAIGYALRSLNKTLSGPTCVVIEDGGSYHEQVTVRDFVNGGSSITIMADPLTGLRPVVTPPAKSTAAFVIANASVSIQGIDIVPTSFMAWGVRSSSEQVTLSSVSITDIAGFIGFAGVQLSSWNAVSDSSVTLLGAHGFYLPESTMTTISNSTAQVNGSSVRAVYLASASANALSNVYGYNTGGGSNIAFYAWNSVSNTVTGGFFQGGYTGLFLDGQSEFNTIDRSTMTGNSYGFFANASSTNTVTKSYIQGALTGAQLSAGSHSNTVDQSTMVGTANYGLYWLNSDSNAVSGSFIHGAQSALYLSGANHGTVSQSTMTGNSFGFNAVGSSSNTITQSYLEGGLVGAQLTSGSNDNAISQSTVTGGTYGFYAAGSVSGVLTQDWMSGFQAGTALDVGSDFNSVSLSTITGTNYGLQITVTSSNTVASSYITGSTAAYINASTGSVIDGSVLVSTSAGGDAVRLTGGSVNLTVTTSTVYGASSGRGLAIEAGNGGNIEISSNVIQSGGQCLAVMGQTSGTSVVIASNTILPAVQANPLPLSYGLYLSGLTTGATIYNNSVFYRTSASNFNNTAYGLFASAVSGLRVHHNRFNSSGSLFDGSVVVAAISGAQNTEFLFNDANYTVAGLINVYGLQVSGSTLTVKNNAFRFTGAASTRYDLFASAASGIVSDYNDWYAGGAALNLSWGNAYTSVAAWSATGNGAHSISADPLWASVAAGSEDFHPQSLKGRCSTPLPYQPTSPPSCAAYAVDSAHSPTIDAGDPAESFSLEPLPHGRRVNIGSYGNTAEASESRRKLQVIIVQ